MTTGNKSLSQYIKYVHKLNRVCQESLKTGMIQPWPATVVNELDKRYKNGLPGSISLLLNGLCSGYCFDMSLLLASAINYDEGTFRIVDAIINEYQLRPFSSFLSSEFNQHRFVEFFEDDESWVYDSSGIGVPLGYRMKRELYYELQQPQICQIISAASFERSETYFNFIYPDKTVLTEEANLAIPYAEFFQNSVPEIYQEHFNERLESFKNEVGYVSSKDPVKRLIKTYTYHHDYSK